MICKKCGEQIEVGEACVTDPQQGHVFYYHVGCHATEVADREEKKRVRLHYEELAQQARSVC